MNKISRFLPYMLPYLILGILICFIFSFWQSLQQTILPPLITGWKIRKAILLFIKYFPYIYISSLLIAYIIIFGKYGPAIIKRQDGQMAKFVRSFFVLSISIVVVYFIMGEVIRPILLEKQIDVLSKTKNYFEYINLSGEAYLKEDYSSAASHIKQACAIWPEGKESKNLSEKIKIAQEKAMIKSQKNLQFTQDAYVPEKFDPSAALKIAENSMQVFDFYTAHYYAKVAFDGFENDLISKQRADILRKESWKEIGQGIDRHLEKSEIDRFWKKKKAYDAMQAGRYIEAYYGYLNIYKDLLKTNEDKIDPEVERFLKIAENTLKENVFFSDELDHIKEFDVGKDITFTITTENSDKMNMTIYGISYSYKTGYPEIYLKGIKYNFYNSKNTLLKSFFIPYAKLIEKKDEKGEVFLLLQVRALDRNIYGKDIEPILLTGEASDKDFYNIKIPITIDDFYLLDRVSNGPNFMKLADLYSFGASAEKYGFIKQPYLREMVFILTEPLLLLISSVLAIIIAWNCRLSPEKRSQKKRAVIIPFCLLIAYFLDQTVQYISRLGIAFFVDLLLGYAPIIILGTFIFSFTVATAILLCQRSE